AGGLAAGDPRHGVPGAGAGRARAGGRQRIAVTRGNCVRGLRRGRRDGLAGRLAARGAAPARTRRTGRDGHADAPVRAHPAAERAGCQPRQAGRGGRAPGHRAQYHHAQAARTGYRGVGWRPAPRVWCNRSSIVRRRMPVPDSQATQEPATAAPQAAWSPDSIPTVPYMEETGLALLRERLARVRTYLEYGSGGSSLMAAKADVRRIYSVDTDKQFLQAVRQRLLAEGVPRRRFVPVYANIGATGAWGRPKNSKHATLWPRYCAEPWRK